MVRFNEECKGQAGHFGKPGNFFHRARVYHVVIDPRFAGELFQCLFIILEPQGNYLQGILVGELQAPKFQCDLPSAVDAKEKCDHQVGILVDDVEQVDLLPADVYRLDEGGLRTPAKHPFSRGCRLGNHGVGTGFRCRRRCLGGLLA